MYVTDLTIHPGKGGYPQEPAALDLRGCAAHERRHAQGLQHPEGLDASPHVAHRRGRWEER